MNKITLAALFASVLFSSCYSIKSTESTEYLFSYFTGRSEAGLHLASSVGVTWKTGSEVRLTSDKVIDACVARLAGLR